ncbi:MAG: hypothetical protein IPN32_08115 [Deltaproteobacteria bacterium]|nr:hypothetical protein [Deltaproteobacteria bacterium]
MRSLHGKQWWIFCCCSVASACSDGGFGGAAEQGCPKELREISPDARFGDASSWETPRQVIELLERPASGTVTWLPLEDSEFLEVHGASGTTTFTAQASAGPRVRLREGIVGKGGVPQLRIACPTEFVFDVSVHIETADGALVEDWRGEGTYGVTGHLGADGTLGVEIDPPAAFAGTLRVAERSGVSEAWEDRQLRIFLTFATSRLDVVGMSGVMQYFLENGGDGELYGVNTTIAEFARPVEDTSGG